MEWYSVWFPYWKSTIANIKRNIEIGKFPKRHRYSVENIRSKNNLIEIRIWDIYRHKKKHRNLRGVDILLELSSLSKKRGIAFDPKIYGI